MKRITKLSLLKSSLKIARIVFLTDLLLMVPVVHAGESTTEGAVIINKNVGNKEDRMNTTNDSLKTLITLCQDKIDQVFLLKQVIEDLQGVKEPKNNENEIQQKLQDYKDKLDEQIHQISKLITDLKGEAPSYSRDLKGLIYQGWEKVRGIAGGTGGELKALSNNIGQILDKEEGALRSNWPENSKSVLEDIAKSTRELKNYLEVKAIPQATGNK